MNQIDKITTYLYISGLKEVTEENVNKFQLSCIVNATNFENDQLLGKNIEIIKVPVEDGDNERIIDYFDQVSDKIKSVKENNGRILVHCLAGISRSPTLCIAYFVKHENLSLEKAFKRVFRKRLIISPNNGFWKQLIEYEKRLRGGEPTVFMVTRSDGEEAPDLYKKLSIEY